MTVYIDASVVLSWLLNQEPTIGAWGYWNAAYTSELCRVEFHRTIDRLRLSDDLDDDERVFLHERFSEFWRSVHRVQVSTTILDRACQTLPTVLGTLDAIHLFSAELADGRSEDGVAEFLTHDRQLGTAAHALGFAVRGTAVDGCEHSVDG